MADSFLNMGANPVIFPFTPNWISLPKSKMLITRYQYQYPGSASIIQQMNKETPISFTATFSFHTRKQIYDFLTFVHTQLGRKKRFWFKYPKVAFDLYQDASSGASTIYVYGNNFQLSGLGYERIYFEMSNGDMVVRRVESNEYNKEFDRIELFLTTPLDRAITMENHISIGRFLLVRFDQDDFDFPLETDRMLKTELAMYELVKEYGDF